MLFRRLLLRMLASCTRAQAAAAPVGVPCPRLADASRPRAAHPHGRWRRTTRAARWAGAQRV